jgi:sulfoxide reductase heme-binding subunit YedZ
LSFDQLEPHESALEVIRRGLAATTSFDDELLNLTTSFEADEFDSVRPSGWRLVGVATLLVCLMTAALLLYYGAGEDGLPSVIRNTARTSFILFLAGFVGPALAALRPARAMRRLAAEQSHLFAAFAASHLVHAVAIFTLAWRTGGASLEGRPPAIVAAGGLVYLCILAAAAPAFSRAARWLAARPKLSSARTVGLYLVWLTFADSYGGRAVRSIFYVPFALALLAALALRLIPALKRRVPAHDSARADAPAA